MTILLQFVCSNNCSGPLKRTQRVTISHRMLNYLKTQKVQEILFQNKLICAAKTMNNCNWNFIDNRLRLIIPTQLSTVQTQRRAKHAIISRASHHKPSQFATSSNQHTSKMNLLPGSASFVHWSPLVQPLRQSEKHSILLAWGGDCHFSLSHRPWCLTSHLQKLARLLECSGDSWPSAPHTWRTEP